METITNPLTEALPAEVPLKNAPLVRVIAQVRFPQMLSIEKRDFVAPFQEAIRSQYPVLRAEQTQALLLGSQASPPVSPVAPRVIWRFTDMENVWRVSLAPDFAAVETTTYKSREDFFARFEKIVQALVDHVDPKVVDRIGVRYIDRVKDSDSEMQNIVNLVRSEMLGIAIPPLAQHTVHALSEALFSIPERSAQLFARWGLLPEKGTVDPSAIEPIDEPSWILDLDMFRKESRPFDKAAVVTETRFFAERIYTFFRWAVTDEFLRLYGGQL